MTPIPNRKESSDVKPPYIKAIRRKFGLTPSDGVTDKVFYSKK